VTEKMMADYEDLPFSPLAEGSPVHVAVLWGNPEIGPAAVMVKFPEGYQEPWHYHSSTYHAVLVKGEFSSRSPEGGPDSERVFLPGSYIVQPGGVTHAEINSGDGELLAMVYFDGPVDFVLAE
jgi:quercetin dioxygenase-like cupin family protein